MDLTFLPNARRALAVALLLPVLFAAGCGLKATPAGTPATPQEPPPTAVTVDKVSTRKVPIYIDQIGRCVSPETVAIRAQAAGQITDVEFKEGDDLKVGAKLFTIDPAPYDAALKQAQAEVDVNKAALEQTKAVLAQYAAQLEESQADLAQNQSRQILNESEWKRAQGLKDVIAKTDYDTKKMAADAGAAQIHSNEAAIKRYGAQIKQGDAAIKVAQERIKSSEAMVHQAEINLAYTKITSPIDGRAGQRMVDKGNVVTAAGVSTQTLLTIQSMDPIYAEFSIPERELWRVQKKGELIKTLEAECSIPETPNESRIGEVIFVDNTIQDGTGTIRLRARLKNPDHLFWPGQFVKVRLIYERKPATLVSSEAVQLGQSGPFVFVVTPDAKAELRPVKLGLRYDKMVALDEGVKDGETVVLKGQLMLQPGARVAAEFVTKEKEKEVEAKKDGEKAKDDGAKKDGDKMTDAPNKKDGDVKKDDELQKTEVKK